MPQSPLDEGDTGDKAVGFNGAQDLAVSGVDLVNLAFLILPHPQRAFGPGQSRIAATTGGGNGRKDMSGPGIDFVDAVFGDLEQVLAIKGSAGMGGNVNRAQHLAAVRVQRIDFAIAGKPDLLAIPRDAAHMIDFGKRAVFTNDFSSCVFHPGIPQQGVVASILATGQRNRE
ncbi:hypothetical protein D3C84_540360 [compost metagenome]